MRLIGLFALVGLIACSHGALEAPVYTFGRTLASTKKSGNILSISPGDARLFLAHRLGLSRYHNLRDAREDTLHLLNDHGGTQAPLFSSDDGDTRLRRLLLVIEGVEQPRGIFSEWFLLGI